MHRKTRFHKFIINELLSSLGGAASYRMKPDLLCFKKFPVSVFWLYLSQRRNYFAISAKIHVK